MKFARRDTFKLAGAGFAAAAATPLLGMGNPPSDQALDYASEETRLRVWRLMRGALDDRLNVSWAKARYFGIIGDEMRPMFGVVSVVLHRMRPLDDGTIEHINLEIGYFTDHDGNQTISTYDNPYTGQTVEVPVGGYPPAAVIMGTDLSMRLRDERPEMVINHDTGPLYLSAGDVWMTETTRAETSFPGMPAPFRYSDVATYHASQAALEDPAAIQVPALVGYSSVVGWRPWLIMPDGQPGHLSAFGSGRTGSSMNDVPQAWLDEAEQREPALLHDPISALDPVWNTSA